MKKCKFIQKFLIFFLDITEGKLTSDEVMDNFIKAVMNSDMLEIKYFLLMFKIYIFQFKFIGKTKRNKYFK